MGVAMERGNMASTTVLCCDCAVTVLWLWGVSMPFAMPAFNAQQKKRCD